MDIESIIAFIGQLTNQQRRHLLRRLRVSGLLDDEELMTDQNRLAVAPALGVKQTSTMASVQRDEDNQPLPPTTLDEAVHFVAPEAEQSSQPTVEVPLAPVAAGEVEINESAAEYQSPISGRIVVGPPNEGAGVEEDPHLMSPLPGQAPEQPIGIIFDGGSKGNPGRGYGSYAVDWPGLPQQIVKLQFGNNVTNNEAEYDTLIAALEATLQRLRDQGADPSTATIEIRGDSQLVVYQVLGQWKCKDPRMKLRRDRVRELLEYFSAWRINHHDRSNSVRVLGH